MKKIIVAVTAIVLSISSFAKDPGVNEKVLDAFNKTFQHAKEVVWTQAANNFEVRFRQNEVQLRVQYDKEGNIIHTLRYYQEEHLPLIVLSKIKTKFPERKIFGVTEMSSEEGTYFHVVLEDAKSWLEVKADVYGTISESKKMKKG